MAAEFSDVKSLIGDQTTLTHALIAQYNVAGLSQFTNVINEELMSQKHKVFVSFHHANDQKYRDDFEHKFGDIHEIMVSRSVRDGDIDPSSTTDSIRNKIRDEYLRDSTVTVVLVGAQTWQRKHVDWEIGGSIRNTEYNSRSGLMGIMLPTHPDYGRYVKSKQYDQYKIPPRLHDNIQCGFATLHPWSGTPAEMQSWIHEAFLRRNRINPNNSYKNFSNNRSGDRWYP
jgi:hypothetical protein